jgi:glycosyltransferase involved in cell wall biosynthesis
VRAPMSPFGDISNLVKCKQCGLVYFNPRRSLQEELEFYRSKYHETYGKAFWYESRINLFRRALDKIEALCPGKGRLLDVGCGAGFFLKEAEDRGWKQTLGTEISHPALGYARKLGLEVLEGDLRELASSQANVDLSEDHFDVATAWNVIDQLQDPVGTLREMYRVLKKGGLIALRVSNLCFHLPLYRVIGAPALRLSSFLPHICFHIYAFSPSSIRLILQRIGYANVKVHNSTIEGGVPARNRLERAARHLLFGLAEGIFYLTGGELIVSPSLLVFAQKPRNHAGERFITSRTIHHRPSSIQHPAKVLHIITRLIKGGASEIALLVVVNLDKTRYQTALVSGPSIGPEGEVESKARRLGVDLTIIPSLIREINPIADLKTLYKLYRFIQARQFDIVHTHTSKAGTLGRLAAKLAGVPIIVHNPHSHIFYGYYGRFLSYVFVWIEKILALLTDRILTLTSTGKREHIEYGVGPPSKFTVVHSGVPLERFLNAKKITLHKRRLLRQEFGVNENEQICIFVSRLAPVKGHKYLISAIPKVLENVPSAKFLLVGDGELRGNLEQQAFLELSLPNDSVIFTGLRHDVPGLLAISDLFVLSSINEGMGMVLVEAMAAGLPVVATRVGGVADVVVDGETGILVPPRNPNALSDAIVKLLKDENMRRRMGEAGQARVDPAFGAEAMVRKIESVYEELITRKFIDT